MLKHRLMLLTILILTAQQLFSFCGPDSLQTAKLDTNTSRSVLVPTQVISACYATKVAFEQTKILVDTFQVQITDLKEVKKLQDIQIDKLSKGLTKEHDALTESELKVTALTVQNYHYKKALFITVGTAIIEAFGIYLLVHK